MMSRPGAAAILYERLLVALRCKATHRGVRQSKGVSRNGKYGEQSGLCGRQRQARMDGADIFLLAC